MKGVLQEENLAEAFSAWLYASRGADRLGLVRNVGRFSGGRRGLGFEGNRQSEEFQGFGGGFGLDQGPDFQADRLRENGGRRGHTSPYHGRCVGKRKSK